MINEIRNAFSRSIFEKVKLLKNNQLDKKQEARIKEAISDDLRKFTDLLEPNISKKAFNESENNKIDLHKMGWHDQSKFDPGRSIFHYEHFMTVNDIRELCVHSDSAEEIDQKIKINARIIWILKSENDLLDQLGYKKHRDDPYKAYNEAGIEII
jgi:hypothetical protein